MKELLEKYIIILYKIIQRIKLLWLDLQFDPFKGS